MDATPHPLIPAGHADDVHRASVWVGDAMRLPNEVDVLRARVAELEERVVKQATTITGYQARIEEACAALSAAEVARDAFATEVEALRAERDTLGIDFKEAVGLAEDYKREAAHADAEMERLMTRDLEWQAVFPGCCHPADLARAVAELRAEVERMEAAKCPCFWCNEGQEPKQPRNAATEATDNPTPLWRQAWQRVMKAVGYTDLSQTNDNEGVRSKGLYVDPREVAMRVEAALSPPMLPNRAKLQAAYDALAEHCQTAKHPSPLLLEQLQSLYRLLEDPA